MTGTSAMSHEQLTAEVVNRLDATSDQRLREVMQALIRHLHAFAVDVRLTEAEWMTGIEFLTEVGNITDDKRQEFILLSDTLGLSSLVDTLTHDAADGVTESTILGPFYVPDSPWRSDGDTIALDDPEGEPALVSGTVRSTDGSPVAGAVLDVWQNASKGMYAVQDPSQPSDNLRGRFRTDGDGSYSFRTVRPVPYPIPDDGPVGRLLVATGRHPWRAAHIHMIVSADGFQSVTTHIFDAASNYLDSDTVFGVKGSLVRDFVADDDGMLHAAVDLVLAPRG